MKQIADFAQKIYVDNNYEGFTGDRRFIRDDDGQKAFSKLRSSIAGMYAWRFPAGTGRPDGARRRTCKTEGRLLIKETDFAFKQAFAFCPYSPEAVYRYVNFLLQFNRLEDAQIVAETCQKLDPFNGAIVDLVEKLKSFKKDDKQNQALREQTMNQLRQMEDMARTNPGNVPNLLTLGDAYQQMQNTPRAVQLLDTAL